MTNKYPLTVKEARAALVNEPVGTIVESCGRSQWRLKSGFFLWVESKHYYAANAGREGYLSDTWLGGEYCDSMPCKETYRIISLDSPEHPDYKAPQPKLLSADEALALDELYIVPKGANTYTKYSKAERHKYSAYQGLEVFDVAFADERGWPIVATLEEAEQLVKEGK